MGFLADFREVVKGLKRKKLGEHTTKLCPKCGSPEITISSGFDAYPRLFGITPERYVCAECGYNGSLVLEQTKEETG
jgi:predicted RNA-binding Zn-ribbon protein involved in translation (DUF1610 family)